MSAEAKEVQGLIKTMIQGRAINEEQLKIAVKKTIAVLDIHHSHTTSIYNELKEVFC